MKSLILLCLAVALCGCDAYYAYHQAVMDIAMKPYRNQPQQEKVCDVQGRCYTLAPAHGPSSR